MIIVLILQIQKLVSSVIQVIQMFPNYFIFALRMYLNLSIRVREVKEVSKSDRQLNINDLKLDTA